jgi:hypothetical protein
MAQVVPAAWLRLFNPTEVTELLSGGAGGGADANDMRAHATYSGGYSDTSRTIILFWQARLSLRATRTVGPQSQSTAKSQSLGGLQALCRRTYSLTSWSTAHV